MCNFWSFFRPSNSSSDKNAAHTQSVQFGTSLSKIQSFYKQLIPPIIIQCTVYLSNQEAIQTEGLFRISPKATRSNELREIANRGGSAPFETPHEAATLIKLFLMHLTEPIIPRTLHKSVVHFQDVAAEDQLETARYILSRVPRNNITVLAFLFDFFAKVADYSDYNKMDAENLGTVIGPNLTWSADVMRSFITPTQANSNIIKQMENTPKQFGVTLEHILRFYNQPVPPVLKDCVQFLDGSRLNTPQMFQTRVHPKRLEFLKELADGGNVVPLKYPQEAARLITTFLRELKEPLLTHAAYRVAANFTSLSDMEKAWELKQMIKELPRQNTIVLEFLMQFLTRLLGHRKKNGLSACRLAVLFGSYLVWPPSRVLTLDSIKSVDNFTQFLIENSSVILNTQTTEMGALLG